MKRRKILYFIPFLAIFLTGCSLGDVKSWVKDNIYTPAKTVISSFLNPNLDSEGQKKDEQKPSESQPEEEKEQEQPSHVHKYGEIVPAVEADCENSGHSAYYQCKECGKYFDSNKHETTLEALTIDALGHLYGELIPEVPATCESAGTKAHYKCSRCEQTFDSEKSKVTAEQLVIAPLGHNYGELVAEVSADCEHDGHLAYYHCEECGKYFTDGKVETNLDALKIAALGHAIIEHPEKGASCLETGNTLYYECSRCHHYFSDQACSHEIAPDSWVLPKLAHSPVQHPLVSASCTTSGNTEYFECSECHHYFSDLNCENEIAENSWVIPANGHTVVHHDAVSPSYSVNGAVNGSSEYYECSACNKFFSDAGCEHEIVENSWVIPANSEACNKEINSLDYLFYGTYASSNFGVNDKYVLDRYSTDTANANSGFAFYMPVADTTTGWPNFSLTLPNAIDLSHGSFEISAKANNLTNLQIGLRNTADEAVLKWNLSSTSLTSNWQVIKFTIPANQIADGKDLTAIKKLVFNFNFDQNSGTERAMWLDELHFGEGAYANGSSAYNLEMGTYSGGQWRGNGSTATTIYNDTAISSSNSALKVTFQNHDTSWSSLPGRVFASFDLAQTTGIGSSNTIDVKNSTLSFDIKLSQEFYDTNNSQFTFKHEDSSWAGIEKWYAFNGYTSGNPQTWLHVSIDLSAKYGSETRNANTYAITFGFFGMTTETIQTAWVIFDNVSIVANS